MIENLKIIKIKNMLSILSNKPPWLAKKFEKSFKWYLLLIKEKYISPKNNSAEINIEKEILYPKKYKVINEIKKEIDVPDQVFFGLIEGIIKGPFIILPKIYADVSLTKDIKIIRKKTSLLFKSKSENKIEKNKIQVENK